MAFPHPLHPINAAGSTPSTAHALPTRPRGFIEGGHQLEKLEFALAVAISRGEQGRIQQLRSQIHALGGNQEEPGT